MAAAPLEARALRRERPRQLDVGEPADRSRKIVGRPPHHRALLGEREHPVAGATALLLQHHGAPSAFGRHHDVAGSELVEPARLGGVHRAPGFVEPGEQRAVLLDVAARGSRPRRGPGELGPCALELLGERDRVAVGVVLRERQVEQAAGLFALVPLHEVGGHVVGRVERRRELVRAPRRETGDLIEGDERIPQHHCVSDLQPVPTPIPQPPPPPQPVRVEIPSGTPVRVQLIDPVDTSVNHAGDVFRASLAAPIVVDDQAVVPAGTDVFVKLVDVSSAGRIKGQSSVQLQLAHLDYQGTSYSLASDDYTQAGGSRGKRTAETIGGGAAVGAIIGAIAGGGKGAAIGAGVGGAGGTAVQAATHGEQVRLPAETKLDFTLQAPVNIHYFPDKNRR